MLLVLLKVNGSFRHKPLAMLKERKMVFEKNKNFFVTVPGICIRDKFCVLKRKLLIKNHQMERVSGCADGNACNLERRLSCKSRSGMMGPIMFANNWIHCSQWTTLWSFLPISLVYVFSHRP